MTNVNKPVDLIILDTKASIVNSLEESGLPLSVLSMMVNELASSLGAQLKEHEMMLRGEYQKQLNAAATTPDVDPSLVDAQY